MEHNFTNGDVAYIYTKKLWAFVTRRVLKRYLVGFSHTSNSLPKTVVTTICTTIYLRQ